MLLFSGKIVDARALYDYQLNKATQKRLQKRCPYPPDFEEYHMRLPAPRQHVRAQHDMFHLHLHINASRWETMVCGVVEALDAVLPVNASLQAG